MSKKSNISELHKKLVEISEWFESSQDKDIDEAIKKYEEGQLLAKQLSSEIKTLKNKITKIDASFE